MARKIRLKIKEVAKAQGMSMTRLHHRSEVAYTTIRIIFRDPHADITLYTLARLAEALNVPTGELIEDVNEEE